MPETYDFRLTREQIDELSNDAEFIAKCERECEGDFYLTALEDDGSGGYMEFHDIEGDKLLLPRSAGCYTPDHPFIRCLLERSGWTPAARGAYGIGGCGRYWAFRRGLTVLGEREIDT